MACALGYVPWVYFQSALKILVCGNLSSVKKNSYSCEKIQRSHL